ncbi:MAG: DUF5353 domain-containing protein [Candidatus Pacebacteria bacterium]|nr:DUF5353 domain-containing protein [Candidatus Paceibacterota bacterium]
MIKVLHTIAAELREHVPFTIFGTVTGIVILALIVSLNIPPEFSHGLFWTFHPIHVILSALVTAGMYRRHSKGKLWATVVIGYIGAVGIATLSDCLIPYVGEYLLDLPNRGLHLGFIEKWWLVNPLAFCGIAVAYLRPHTKIPHAGHVLLSTWASLFHITMAIGEPANVYTVILIAVFLFAAVWVPCCTSDIVFPLLFAKE